MRAFPSTPIPSPHSSTRPPFQGPVGSAFAAKLVCSNVFLAGRDADEVIEDDLRGICETEAVLVNRTSSQLFPFSNPIMRLIQFNVDLVERSVSASYLGGIFEAKATFRPGMGCGLHLGPNSQREASDGFSIERASRKSEPVEAWPLGSEVDSSHFDPKVQDLLEQFARNEKTELGAIRTRQLAVVYKGKLVGEYARPGLTPKSPVLGWSMTKSVLNLVVGRAIRLGKFSLKDKGLFPEWENDGRKEISVEDMLHMSSGLKWREYYAGRSTATEMLFLSNSTSASALVHPLEFPSGSFWRYSSADSNLLAEFVRQKVGGTFSAIAKFVKTELFDKIGVKLFVEPDASGNIVFSSFGWAAAREWAKFAMFILNDGVWNGERLLPEGWRDFSRAPVQNSSGIYGAHFWLPGDVPHTVNGKNYSLPEDSLIMSGFQGQWVIASQKENAIFVRLAVDNRDGGRGHGKLINDILAALKS